ncbi:MAG: hypothetical protein AB7N91_28805 [Candidatus Tectimicrobiota bacterium]
MATVAVTFLARGADLGWYASCERFLASYQRYRAGVEHALYILYKGFPDLCTLEQAKRLFSSVPYTPLFLEDNSFDIGAYIEWANQIHEELICVLNTASEILTEDWLRKLLVNFTLPNVGLVGATGSYESLNEIDASFPAFPNPHVRSNAFMLDRATFCRLTRDYIVRTKFDAFAFESGQHSLTRQILARGQEVLLVGRNGRGYAPQWWPTSGTFRLGTQGNLLIADNQTRNFTALRWPEKREFVLRTWGPYLNEETLLRPRQGWRRYWPRAHA